MLGRKDNLLDVSKGKRRKIDEMLHEDESNSNVHSEEKITVWEQREEQRKPLWDALFNKYNLLSDNSFTCLEKSEDRLNMTSERVRLKFQRSISRVTTWLEGCDSMSYSSRDNSESRAEVNAEKNSMGTVENLKNEIIQENPSRKSSVVFSRDSNMGRVDKKIRDEKNKNKYQLRSRKKRQDNFVKEMGRDASQDFDLNGVTEECQERHCEEGRSFQNIRASKKLSQNESYRANDTCNGNRSTCLDKKVNVEKHEPVENDMKSSIVFSRDSNMGKVDKKISDKKNKYQLHSRKKRKSNFVDEMGRDSPQDFDLNGVTEECQERLCEEGRSFQNIRTSKKLSQNGSYGANDTCNERNKSACLDKVSFERHEPVENDMKSSIVFSIDSYMGKVNKKISDKKNTYQQYSRKKRKDNFVEERRCDASQTFDLNGVTEECQKRLCEEGTLFQNIRTFENLSQSESYSANATCNETNKPACLDKVNCEKHEPVENDMKSSIVFSRDSNMGKVDKKISDKKNKYQLHSRKKRKSNFVEEMGRDAPQDFDLNGVTKECQERLCEEGRSFQNIRTSKKLSPNESYRAIDTCNERNKSACLNKKVNFEKHEPVENDMKYPNFLCKHSSEEIKKDYSNENSKFKNYKRGGSKFDPTKISEWRTEFLNFIKYQWEDFMKNPGSMLLPYPKLKPSRREENMSWERIMKRN